MEILGKNKGKKKSGNKKKAKKPSEETTPAEGGASGGEEPTAEESSEGETPEAPAEEDTQEEPPAEAPKEEHPQDPQAESTTSKLGAPSEDEEKSLDAPYYEVQCKRKNGYWKAGIHFQTEKKIVLASELTEQQRKDLEGANQEVLVVKKFNF